MFAIRESYLVVISLLVEVFEFLCRHDNIVRFARQRPPNNGNVNIRACTDTCIHLHTAMRTNTSDLIALAYLESWNLEA